MPSGLVGAHTFTHRRARQIGEQKGAHDGGIATRLFGQAYSQSAKELRNRRVGGTTIFDDRLQFGELHFSECQQDVVFARKVIEKRAFTKVGSVGDVFYRGVREAMLREKIESSAKQAFPDLRGTPLAPIRRSR